MYYINSFLQLRTYSTHVDTYIRTYYTYVGSYIALPLWSMYICMYIRTYYVCMQVQIHTYVAIAHTLLCTSPIVCTPWVVLGLLALSNADLWVLGSTLSEKPVSLLTVICADFSSCTVDDNSSIFFTLLATSAWGRYKSTFTYVCTHVCIECDKNL